MKIFFLTKYYSEYLKYFEKKNSLDNLSFDQHQKVLFDDHFSWPSDFSINLSLKGYETFFSISNYKPLQLKWTLENKINNFNQNIWEKKIVYEQIKIFKPDLLWIFAIYDFYGNFLDDIKPYTKKVVSWISSPYPKNLSFNNIDYMISSDEGLFKNKDDLFEKIIITLPGFNPKISKKITKKDNKIKTNPIIGFSGQFSIDHKIRCKYISELISNNYNIKLSGLVSDSPVKDMLRKFLFFFKGYDFRSLYELLSKFNEFKKFYNDINFLKNKKIKPLFGLDYYQFLSDCDLILNIHADDSIYGGAQRIVEVTGIGSSLITEYKQDTQKQFDFDTEVIGYNTFYQLTEKLEKINNYEINLQSIKIKGQKKTLDSYTIENMYQNVKSVLQ